MLICYLYSFLVNYCSVFFLLHTLVGLSVFLLFTLEYFYIFWIQSFVGYMIWKWLFLVCGSSFLTKLYVCCVFWFSFFLFFSEQTFLILMKSRLRYPQGNSANFWGKLLSGTLTHKFQLLLAVLNSYLLTP